MRDGWSVGEWGATRAELALASGESVGEWGAICAELALALCK